MSSQRIGLHIDMVIASPIRSNAVANIHIYSGCYTYFPYVWATIIFHPYVYGIPPIRSIAMAHAIDTSVTGIRVG